MRWGKFLRCQVCKLDLIAGFVFAKTAANGIAARECGGFHLCIIEQGHSRGIPSFFSPCRVWSRKTAGISENARKHVKTGYSRSFWVKGNFHKPKPTSIIKHFRITQSPQSFISHSQFHSEVQHPGEAGLLDMSIKASRHEFPAGFYLDGYNNPGFSGGPVVRAEKPDQVIGVIGGYAFANETVFVNDGKGTPYTPKPTLE